jgi:hypothetical protein
MEEEKYKITYFLGAGASAKALPTVRPTDISPGYTNSLRQMADKLTLRISSGSPFPNGANFVEDLKWLAEKGDQHGTPDTFAKLCQIKNDYSSLLRVKTTLSLYFTIEQFLERKVDPRYLQFIIKVLDKRKLFPDNIKILNWNYDFQLQLAAENFWKEEFNYSHTVSRHSPPLIDYYPSLGNEFHVNYEKEKSIYSLIHLNGIAGFYFYVQTAHILNYYLNGSLTDINKLFESYHIDKEYKTPLLSFAFENPNNMTNAIRNRFLYANKIIENTDFLVIIGYSFPNDNIETDERIMNTIKSGCLKEIFYQDPFNDGSFLRTTFGVDKEIPITHIKNVEEFYVPRQAKMIKPN